MKDHRIRPLSGATIILMVWSTGVFATSASAQGTMTYERIQCLTPEQEAILGYLTLEMVDDDTGNLVPAICFPQPSPRVPESP